MEVGRQRVDIWDVRESAPRTLLLKFSIWMPGYLRAVFLNVICVFRLRGRPDGRTDWVADSFVRVVCLRSTLKYVNSQSLHFIE